MTWPRKRPSPRENDVGGGTTLDTERAQNSRAGSDRQAALRELEAALRELEAELLERVENAEGHVAAAERDGDARATRLCRQDLEIAKHQLEAVRELLEGGTP